MKYGRLLFLTVVLLVTGGCRTMYQIDLQGTTEQDRSINTQYPNYINMLVRVTDGRITRTDEDGNQVPDFSNPDYYVVGLEPRDNSRSRGNFSVLENGTEVKVEAGLRVVPLEELELHVNLLLDVSGSVGEAGLLHAKNASKRLVARPCTSEEADAGECFAYVYSDWDAKTNSIVERSEQWRSILKENQIVTLYTFSNAVRRIRLREADVRGQRYPDKARQILDTIDREVVLGVDSTNLYGALLAGLEDLSSVRTLNDPTKGFVDGVVLVFTDGSHTSGDIRHRGQTLSPRQAIERIGRIRGGARDLQSLRLIALAVDSPELQESIRTGDLAGGGLRDLQNAGYLKVDDFDRLEDRFTEAFELIDRYTRSLYWIYYRSPKSGFQRVDIELRVTCPTCTRGPDGSVPEYASIVETIQTNGFYQVIPGVYINDPVLDDRGLPASILNSDDENIALRGPELVRVENDPDRRIAETGAYSLIVANNPDSSVQDAANATLLRLHTYVRANDNRFKPRYTVTSSNPRVATVIGDAALTAIESVALVECLQDGVATITVVDTANGNLRSSIACECAISPPTVSEP